MPRDNLGAIISEYLLNLPGISLRSEADSSLAIEIDVLDDYFGPLCLYYIDDESRLP